MAKKSITDEINELKTLRAITRSYSEIASSRMKRSRDKVLLDRGYMAEIDKIFKEVLISYRRDAQKLVGTRKIAGGGEKITFLAHNGKKAIVFFSANSGFYGEIVRKTFALFSESVKSNPDAEATIVGRSGLALFKESFPSRYYSFFELSDHNVDPKTAGELITHLVQYEEVLIYYGLYKTVASQVASVKNIAALIPDQKTDHLGGESGSHPRGVKEGHKYLFEPALSEILKFFETEIFSSIFDQVIRESQLAKFASRIMAMEAANKNIEGKFAKANIGRIRYAHSEQNSKQLNSLSSVMYTRRSDL